MATPLGPSQTQQRMQQQGNSAHHRGNNARQIPSPGVTSQNNDIESNGGASTSWMNQTNAAAGGASVDGNATLPSHASLPQPQYNASNSTYGIHQPSHNLKATAGNTPSNTGLMDGGRAQVVPATTAAPAYDESGPPPRATWTFFCCELHDAKKEMLEYDYTRGDKGPNGQTQAYPRIRARGEYYIDSYNDQPWSWTFGTHEKVCSRCWQSSSLWTMLLLTMTPATTN